MKTAFACALIALTGGAALSTDYSKDRSLKVESVIKVTSEMTEMTRDGEPVENMGAGMKSVSEWHVVQIDEVTAHEGNKPTKVKRHFEKVAASVGRADEPKEIESPFDGATLELSADGDEVKIEFLEGKKPDHEGALAGHKLALALDALLPDKEVEKDAKWDLDNDQIKRALGTDLQKSLFPPPPREEGAAGGGGGGGGGGGRRGGMRGNTGGSPLGLAEWKGKAKLVSLSEDVDGQKCAKVEITISAKGDMPEPQMGGGRRRPGMFENESSLPAFESTYTMDAEGTFYFALEGKRPVSLELEGTTATEMNREMRGREEGSTMKLHVKSEGKLSVKIDVSDEAKDAKKK